MRYLEEEGSDKAVAEEPKLADTADREALREELAWEAVSEALQYEAVAV